MKKRIIVKCDCGKKWEDEETPEAAQSWWRILDALDPGFSKAVEKKGDEKTVQMALRILWARHEAYRQEKGDKKPHDATVTEEITLESLQEVKEMKGEKHDSENND